jgi:hypothetical protein
VLLLDVARLLLDAPHPIPLYDDANVCQCSRALVYITSAVSHGLIVKLSGDSSDQSVQRPAAIWFVLVAVGNAGLFCRRRKNLFFAVGVSCY